MKNFKKILSVFCLSAIITSGRSDAKISSVLDGIKDLVLGAGLGFGGYQIKNYSPKIKPFWDAHKETLIRCVPNSPITAEDIEAWMPTITEKSKTIGTVVLAAGIVEGVVGIAKLFD